MTGREEPLDSAMLSPQKAALLDKWIRGRTPVAADAKRAGILPRSPGEADAPLSFSQGRLWFLHQLDPASAAYTMFTNRRLRGPLRADAIERALTEVVRRHACLRTVYAMGPDGAARQVVQAPAPVPLPVVDLSAIAAAAEREAAARRLADEEAACPFDLSRDPVLRARLLRLAPDDHVLLLTVHHIAYDDWSERVLLQELAVLYEAVATGQETLLPEPPIQYAEYASWQRRAHEEGRFREAVGRWRGRLAGVRPLDLPTDRPRPPARRDQGSHYTFTLPTEIAERVGAFARQEGVTLFMALLAAYEATLHRWSGHTDLAVGTPIAGRGEAGTQGLVGFFVNTLVIRNGVSPDFSFRALLARVKAACASAYSDAEVPFDVLVKELHPQRDPSRTPFVQTVFLLQQEPLPAPALGAARSEPFPVTVRTSKFDFTLLVRQAADGFEGIIEYDSALFDEPTISRVAEAFAALLRHVIDHPDAPLREAPAPRPKPAPAMPAAPPALRAHARDRYRVAAHAAPAPARSLQGNDP